MRRAGWLVAALAALVLGGCGSEDDGPVKPPSGATYPERTSPQNVLQALLLSYQNRDSTEYKSLHDSSYVGTSTDLNAPPDSQISTFTYADEAAHIAALRRESTITSVVLDFGPSSSWTRLASDDPSHPDWARIQMGIGSWRVEITDGSTIYSTQAINPMTYAFAPTVTSPGDTTWRIIRWTEVGGGY